MKRTPKICGVLLISLFAGLLNTCSSVEADAIEVYPVAVNFGDVELGSNSSGIVTVMNTGFLSVSITSLTLTGSSDFQIVDPPSLPYAVGPTLSLYITVLFSPGSEGAAAANLEISGINAGAFVENVELSGTGVPASTPPASVADILAFFDDSAASGSLSGSGPGNSADGRMKALRNMIEAAGDLIEDGQIDEARQQLQNAYQRADGQPKPPDFVAGDAAAELAQMLIELISTL